MPMTDAAGLPVTLEDATTRGLAAFRAGRYEVAFDAPCRAKPELGRVGGSHARREAELVARARRRGAEDGFTARRRTAIARLERAGIAAE